LEPPDLLSEDSNIINRKEAAVMQVLDARRQYIRWLLATDGLSAHTIRAYDGDLTAFERHTGPALAAAAIDRALLVGFLEGQREPGLAPTTIKRRASGVRGLCRWPTASGVLNVDPWSGLGVSVGRRRLLPRNVPDRSLDALLDSVRGRLAVPELPERPGSGCMKGPRFSAIALMVGTGVRVGEVVSIRCMDIDLARRIVRIRGKGSREREVYLTNDWIAELTGAQLAARSGLAFGYDRLLFNRHMAPFDAAGNARSAAQSRRRGEPRHHGDTEHAAPSAATRLIEAGVDIRFIQALLGHASLSTTEIYTHISNVALQRVVTRVDVLGRSAVADN
jgi:integrase/recombinase XerD